jgi:predicted dehydrogenase
VGERNGLTIRVYGEKAGLRWRQEDPNHLWLFHDNGRSELFRRAIPTWALMRCAPRARPAATRRAIWKPSPISTAIRARMLRGEDGALVPGMADGLRGMALIEQAVPGQRAGAGWVDFTV